MKKRDYRSGWRSGSARGAEASPARTFAAAAGPMAAAKSFSGADLTADRLPKVLRSFSTVRGPTPGMAFNSLVKVRASRRERWKVTAKRWASSRMVWTR